MSIFFFFFINRHYNCIRPSAVKNISRRYVLTTTRGAWRKARGATYPCGGSTTMARGLAMWPAVRVSRSGAVDVHHLPVSWVNDDGAGAGHVSGGEGQPVGSR